MEVVAGFFVIVILSLLLCGPGLLYVGVDMWENGKRIQGALLCAPAIADVVIFVALIVLGVVYA